jgi:gamma-glutamyltranspeptidase/glutathione hydrolase
LADGGILTLCRVQDLANYSPGWAEPIHTTYRGYDIYSNPSTTRGGMEVLMGLNLLEGWDIASYGDPNHPMVLHLQVTVAAIWPARYV